MAEAERTDYTDAISSTEEIIEDARNGKMFILVDHEDRENEGDLVIPAQMCTPNAINFMAKHGRGLICLTLTGARLDALGLPLMATSNSSRHETAFTVSIEAREGVSTGISAHDRALTVAVVNGAQRRSPSITTASPPWTRRFAWQAGSPSRYSIGREVPRTPFSCRFQAALKGVPTSLSRRTIAAAMEGDMGATTGPAPRFTFTATPQSITLREAEKSAACVSASASEVDGASRIAMQSMIRAATASIAAPTGFLSPSGRCEV